VATSTITRTTAKEALPALGVLAWFLLLWAVVHGLETFCRALFGTLEGAVGWIPYAGRILRAPIHKIMQKISHTFGRAERGIDARIGTAFHRLTHIVKNIARELEEQAKLTLGIALLLDSFLTFKHFRKLLRLAVAPVWKMLAAHAHGIHRTHDQARAAQRTGTKAQKGVTVTAAATAALGVRWWRMRVNSRLQAHSRAIARLSRWVRGRSLRIPRAAALAAVGYALGRLGLRWLQCSNVKRLGRAVCRSPRGSIDALIALLTTALVLRDLRGTARMAEDVLESVTGVIWDAASIGDRPRGKFTIE
jgi:hypothetical protein